MKLPERVDVLVEVPKGGFVKRELDAAGESTIDFISPVPCPFNYGCVPEVPGLDGDPLDVVILGPRLKAGQRYDRSVVGIVRFWDAGHVDDKLVAGDAPMTESQRRALSRFFRVYALARGVLNLRKGLSGRTEFLGVITRDEANAPWRNGR